MPKAIYVNPLGADHEKMFSLTEGAIHILDDETGRVLFEISLRGNMLLVDGGDFVKIEDYTLTPYLAAIPRSTNAFAIQKLPKGKDE